MSADNQEQPTKNGFEFHSLSWADFDDLSHGGGGAAVVRRLRQAERSRRLLLLRAVADELVKDPDLLGPLPSSDVAWELLARVEDVSSAAFELVISHPYTGSWAGYTIRLLRNRMTGTCPLWMHAGHLHAIAAAAAIHAGVDFCATVPVWHGGAILPTLGLVRLPCDSPWSIATVHGKSGRVEVGNESARIPLPENLGTDGEGWCSVRQLAADAGRKRLTIRLDDLDPYRGLYEPILPSRLSLKDFAVWSEHLDDAWNLIVRSLPELADGYPLGLDSVSPIPAVPFRLPSASTGEAFGSAIISQPSDGAELAAMLVHEFQHIRLGSLMHLVPLHNGDPRERFYVPWRDDPRPVGGVLQGVYAFLGVTELWRAIARGPFSHHRAHFEFAYWRRGAWRVLQLLQSDSSFTPAGVRFLAGIAGRLEPWLDEPVPTELAAKAEAAIADHYAGWRLRHLRPQHVVVTKLAQEWLSGAIRPAFAWAELTQLLTDVVPTPVPDGSWSQARTDLIRATLKGRNGWEEISDATTADLAYVKGDLVAAARGYRDELAADGERPASWVGLGLALSRSGRENIVGRVLLRYPELVRAVHREICLSGSRPPSPDRLASWIAQVLH